MSYYTRDKALYMSNCRSISGQLRVLLYLKVSLLTKPVVQTEQLSSIALGIHHSYVRETH